MHYGKSIISTLLLAAAMLPLPAEAALVSVRVTVENLSPDGGTFLTPPWVGFHDGSFDLFNQGEAVGNAGLPAGLESLAEDGATGMLSGDFAASAIGGIDGTLSGPLAPGQTSSMIFLVDNMALENRYFSWAAMVIPSNDAFIANGNPMAHALFGASGAFLGADFMVPGSAVWDAGTEVNDELPSNTAFFGQMAPNTGVDQNGVVAIHGGFLAPGSGGILDDPMFANADFKADGYQMARITVSAVPEPSTWLSLLSGSLLLMGFLGRRRQKAMATSSAAKG